MEPLVREGCAVADHKLLLAYILHHTADLVELDIDLLEQIAAVADSSFVVDTDCGIARRIWN